MAWVLVKADLELLQNELVDNVELKFGIHAAEAQVHLVGRS
jgi:hypothetical protein